ncbi:hypothetical protein MMC12_002114 [Toensbergia leucococca]|nr:hypothetical protein [Toensbergia leucococca]
MTEPDLSKLATTLLTSGPKKQKPSPLRIRILYNKTYIADTLSAQYVWEHDYYPVYYVPIKDINDDALKWDKPIPNTQEGAYLSTLTVGEKSTDRILVFTKGALKGLVRIEFGAVDSWLEEDTPIYIHPKDPYKRISTIPSSRTITIKIAGHTIAESSSPLFLLETELPMRFYLPPTSVNWKYLSASETVTGCPYKGDANYYNVAIDGKEYKDIIWWYKLPTAESMLIAGKLCFYNEKVDVFIDGVEQERPKSFFS